MDIFKKPAAIIIILSAIVIAVVWSYIEKRSTEKETQLQAEQLEQEAAENLINLATVDPSEFDEYVRNEYAQARIKAEEIDKEHKLSAIQVNLPSLGLNSGETRYIFSSASDNINNWIITFSQESGNYLRAEIPKNDYLGDMPPMDTSLWKFNYVTAIQIFENGGGKDWREKNGLSSASLLLKHDTNYNFLTWTVSYTNGEQDFTKIINASNGKFIE